MKRPSTNGMEFAGQGKRISAIQLTKLIKKIKKKNFVNFSFLLFLEFQQPQYRNTKNDVRLISFSLFFFLYLANTNIEFCISPHLAKKLYTIHIKSINSNFNNIQPKDSAFQGFNFLERIQVLKKMRLEKIRFWPREGLGELEREPRSIPTGLIRESTVYC